MRRGVVWMWGVLAQLVLVPGAWAQRPPETHPSSARQDVVMTWDRSAMPGDIELWAPRTVLGYEAQGTMGYGSMYLTCRSESDAASGKCPTADTKETTAVVRSAIPLRFTEKRSGMAMEINVMADLRRGYQNQSCSLDFWSDITRFIWSSAFTGCAGDPVGSAVRMELPATELRQLVAGKWTAELTLDLSTLTHLRLATYTFTFDLTITDHNAVAIYFPEFPQTTPLVDLNLRYDPLAHTVGGRKSMDMCLYDGLGSQSDYLGITVTDTSGRTPGPLGYSLWHDDGGNDDDQRLDYMIELEHAGVRRRMASGVEEQLHGIDTAPLHLVLLPGMSQPVFCVPTPLLLTTPRVPITDQRAGGYEGELKVQLRVPTTRP